MSFLSMLRLMLNFGVFVVVCINDVASARNNPYEHDRLQFNATLMSSLVHISRFPANIVLLSKQEQSSSSWFRLLLPPSANPMLCRNFSDIENFRSDVGSFVTSSLGEDNSYPFGILLNRTQNETSCSLQDIITNVEYINRKLLQPMLEIQYLILHEGSGFALEEKNYYEENGYPVSSTKEANLTLIYTSTEAIHELQRDIEVFSEDSPNEIVTSLFENNAGNGTFTVFLKIDHRTNSNSTTSSKDKDFNAMSGIHFAVANLFFVIIIMGCLLQSYFVHRRKVAEAQAHALAREIRRQRRLHAKREYLLTEPEFDALPEIKYEDDLYIKLKTASIKLENDGNCDQDNTLSEDKSKTDTSPEGDSSSSALNSSNDGLSDANVTRLSVHSATIPAAEQDGKSSKTLVQRIMSGGLSMRSSSNVDQDSNDDLEAQDTTDNDTEDIFSFHAGGTCPICIDDFIIDEKVIVLPCYHAYHKDCVRQWLLEKQGCCPTCKARVLSDEQLKHRAREVAKTEDDAVIANHLYQQQILYRRMQEMQLRF